MSDLSTYYTELHYQRRVGGDHQEWRIYNNTSSSKDLYIVYNGAADLVGDPYRDCSWLWYLWYSAPKADRQEWFKQQQDKLNVNNITATAITNKLNDLCCTQPCAVATYAHLPIATCPPSGQMNYINGQWIHQQEGINPMKTSTTISSADISISAPPSDISKMRDYLISRLSEQTGRYEWNDPKYSEFAEKFNLNAPKRPATSQGIIDAFKNGKVTIDQAKVDKQTKYFAARDGDFEDYEDDYDNGITSQYFGITFTDLPVADRKGYDAAVVAYNKAKQDTKDTIMIADPVDGLAALKALQEWTPTGAAN